MMSLMRKLKKRFSVVLIVALILTNLNSIMFAKATNSEAEKVTSASVSDVLNDVEEEEVVEEGEEGIPADLIEEPEEDEMASPSDVVEEIAEEISEEATEDIEASPSNVEEESDTLASSSELNEIENNIDEMLTTMTFMSAKKASPSLIVTSSVLPTPSDVIMDIPLFKAPAVTPIYMYLAGDVIHFTTDSTSPNVLYNGGTIGDLYSRNNVETGLLSGAGKSYSDIVEVVIDSDLYPTEPRGLFSNLSNLTTITNFNKLHLDNAITVEAMFTNCTNLTSVDMSTWNMQNVEYADYMFAQCGVSTVNMGGWSSAKKLKTVSGMFFGCQNLTNINAKSMQTKNVTNFYGMFASCTSLATLDLSSFNTASASNMASMFENCSNLETIDISSFDTSNVTDMHQMFYPGMDYSTSTVKPSVLKNIYIGSKFVAPAGANTTDMFTGCTMLPGYDPANTDGSMISTYTKPKPVTPPAPYVPRYSNNSNSGSSSGGGGGGGRSVTSFKPAMMKITEYSGVKKENILNAYSTAFYYDAKSNLWYLIKNVNDNQVFAVNEFCNFNGSTYFFDSNGIMTSGWVKDALGDYYLFEWEGLNIGKMIKGWKKVDNKWYYLDITGKMLVNAAIPDGYVVGIDGSWIGNTSL